MAVGECKPTSYIIRGRLPIDGHGAVTALLHWATNPEGVTMGTSASIDVSYRCEDGWHIFEAVDMPGLYIANHDPKRAFNAVGPAIEQLIELDTGRQVQAAPEVSFADFIGSNRTPMAGSAHQRFNLFQATP